MAVKPKADTAVGEILKLAIMAVGGQGGGVLTSWIETLARSQGYDAQATSVAGVSQRTGATIYYLEMTPSTGQQPVFALAPSGGDVDVLIAAEMMEVGRSIMRGFVTPDKTTLIGSTHRQLAVSEKSIPGDGIADADEVRAAAEVAAQRLILADMDRLAVEQGSVISASLFGALAGSGALPFTRAAFEDAIRAGGKGVEASLRAFDAGFKTADQGPNALARAPVADGPKIIGPKAKMRDWAALLEQVKALPEPVQMMAETGLRKVVDFQDVAYGAGYLAAVSRVQSADSASQDWLLTNEAAKYIANAMAYDDVIKVADLKTRASRHARIRQEMGAGDDQLIQLTEFFHPRAEEIAGLMPAKMGAKWEASERRMARLDRWFGKGRRLRTDSLRAFLMLHVLGGLKGYRLRTRRHSVEVAHCEKWMQACLEMAAQDYALAVELVRNRRLIKGYSDTHARGLSKFDRVMAAAHLLEGREDAAQWMARLREAALQDPAGKALEGAIATVESFV
ncbi:indolepyruvate oxidoreductase subunit beta family protein [Sulfitobacter sp. TSTF-M16]|uniref:Indolepyruvate oxidoreductase subunit beta family protein n=2 Tax=Sulfitobacter aestuariivivens TaxID=2766981 RepID=A0A927HHK4_9RHOB|nr:indolepyruvate oxidoreductase subunit beta family protein [Sulfitobacter aestuariivivens]